MVLWSDPEKPLTLEEILTNVSMYWFTGTYPTSYWVYAQFRSQPVIEYGTVNPPAVSPSKTPHVSGCVDMMIRYRLYSGILTIHRQLTALRRRCRRRRRIRTSLRDSHGSRTKSAIHRNLTSMTTVESSLTSTSTKR